MGYRRGRCEPCYSCLVSARYSVTAPWISWQGAYSQVEARVEALLPIEREVLRRHLPSNSTYARSARG